MKRITLLIAILFATFGLNQMSAQIADLKNAYKGVVKIITYKADGTILRDGTGVFLNKEGDCAASFALPMSLISKATRERLGASWAPRGINTTW